MEQARLEGGEKAVELREAAVKPLRAEVARMRAALADLQSAYTSDIAQVSARPATDVAVTFTLGIQILNDCHTTASLAA